MIIDKERIIYELHKNDSFRKFHRKLTEDLVGCLREEYLGIYRGSESGEIILKSNYLKHFVDMFTSLLLRKVHEEILDEIIKAINSIEEMETLEDSKNEK